MKTIPTILLIFMLPINAFSQASRPSTESAVDTSLNVQETPPQSNSYGVFSMFNGNPGKAALYSLIIPGGGQYFNKRYWKVPVALAAEGLAIYNLIQNINTFRKWDEKWKSLANGVPTCEFVPSQVGSIKTIRDSARTQKDNSWLIFLGVHLVVTADAFIDRHLIEFDVSEDLSFKLNQYQPGVSLVYHFH